MVQVFTPSPAAMQRGQVGQQIGAGLAKRLGLAEAEKAFQQAEGDPLKLATAMGRLTSVSPDLARAAGPMYEAMLRQGQGKALGPLGEGGEGGEGAGVQPQPGATSQGPQQAPQPFPFEIDEKNLPNLQELPTLTETGDLGNVMRGYISPTADQIRNEAGMAYRRNPAQFGGDPGKAIQAVNEKYDQFQKIANDYEKRHKTLSDIQEGVKTKLNNYAETLDARIPPDTFSRLEEQALSEVKKGNLTEEGAMRKYGKKADEISRQYGDLEALGKGGFIQNPKESKSKIKTLQKEFKKRGDLRNFADKIVSDMGVSYPTAWSFADPIKDHPALNNYMEKLPANTPTSPRLYTDNTEKIVPKLAKMIKNENASPQAVFDEMQRKGYDPYILRDYLSNNRDDLKLSPLQVDQLDKEIRTSVPYLNDIWMNIFGR